MRSAGTNVISTSARGQIQHFHAASQAAVGQALGLTSLLATAQASYFDLDSSFNLPNPCDRSDHEVQ